MRSLIFEYGPRTEKLYLEPHETKRSLLAFPVVVVFTDSFKLPIELVGIMHKKPIFDHYDLISRSKAILEHLRKTGQKAAVKEAYNAEGLMESEWADVFLFLQEPEV